MPDDDFKDFLTALSAARVRHLVVGAFALASHGHVRATGDLDVWIEPTRANVERLRLAIRAFADASLEYFKVTESALAEGVVGFYMGTEPDRIDIHTSIDGLTFAQAWHGRMAARSFGVPVDVLGLNDLITAKRASLPRRPHSSIKALQDAADLAWLEARAERTSGPRRPPLRTR